MKILFFGDIFGRSGRDALIKQLPNLKNKYKPDFILANGENASHGKGISHSICKELFSAGVDVITGGNHIFDNSDVFNFIDEEKRLLRPNNYPIDTPGRGYEIFEKNLKKILVINVMGRVFMQPLDDPFESVRKILNEKKIGKDVSAIIIDIHCEATSEKMAIGHEFDGKASLIVGTHTHVPTADGRILTKGTAFISDLGMCGDYDSIIGMDKVKSLERFKKKIPIKGGMNPATGEATLSLVYVEIDDETGLASSIKQVIIGGSLKEIS
ncbi:MAG: hypothetical protein CFH26_00392 [Alphaproteobacteria bacterium MarineAlpha6_Bin4]|nr:MAG: hypothetical protein CFH25_00138 [Alphaproteobacteria bacterium MarineAlpha6_Bin3]PPR38033.1 MAG: hypothetical protein CFH26_00392 [Alphaproteobacteria bacterium MarineAlpha6_Bin4]|tara:strand:- start:4949 stop:5755 length:807 start_codon:yes stop_codon:yes gene_type:complete